MATIKLTGFNTATARSTTGATTDTVVTDGSLTIGDADTDTIIVNAEFDSDLIPDDASTYDLGSAAKPWRVGYFDEINAKLRHVTTNKYRSTTTNREYVKFDNAGANTSPGVNNKFLAPTNGKLLTVRIRATTTPNATDIAFHKASDGSANLNTTAVETVGVDMSSANTSYEVTFTNASFSTGEILGLSITPTNNPNDVNVTAVWEFDWT